MKKLAKLKALTSNSLLRKAPKCFKTARSFSRAGTRLTDMQKAVILFYEIEVDRLGLARVEVNRRLALYDTLGNRYKKLGNMTVLPSHVRYKANFNAIYCYGMARRWSSCENATKRAIQLDKSNPHPYINCAILNDINSKKRRAIYYYKKALLLFKEYESQGKKYPEKLTKLKKKVEIRLNNLTK